MRVVVTGAGGQLGRELCDQWGETAQGFDHKTLDICSTGRVREVLEKEGADLVVNTAAYTAVDQAEQDAETCRQVNVDAVRGLAEVCRDLGARLVHVSTDYVFSGERRERSAWMETDPIAPRGVYATSKADGEAETRTAPASLVVRTCGLYPRDALDRDGGNFVSTMARLSRSVDRVRVVDDQTCTPSYVPHVAAAIVHLCERGAEGTYHVTNTGATTWCEMARRIMELLDRRTQVEAISTEEYGAAAPRPTYSVLDTSKYERFAEARGGPMLARWDEALAECLRS